MTIEGRKWIGVIATTILTAECVALELYSSPYWLVGALFWGACCVLYLTD